MKTFFLIIICISISILTPIKDSEAQDLLPITAALFTSTFCHEAGHAVAILANGGKITKFKFSPTEERFGYIEWENVSHPAGVYIASEVSQFIVLNNLIAYREENQDSKFLNYWTIFTYLDFPVHVVMSYFQDEGDINNFCRTSGVPKEALVVAAALQTVFYFNKINPGPINRLGVKNLTSSQKMTELDLKLEENSLSLEIKIRF